MPEIPIKFHVIRQEMTTFGLKSLGVITDILSDKSVILEIPTIIKVTTNVRPLSKL